MKDLNAILKDRPGEKEYRLTPQREAILNTLVTEEGSHLSVDEIYRSARGYFPGIGLATVYRALDLFKTLGIVRELDCGGCVKYELNLHNGTYHYHLICLGCGKILEIHDLLPKNVDKVIYEKYKFKVTDRSLRLWGYCANCRSGEGEVDNGE